MQLVTLSRDITGVANNISAVRAVMRGGHQPQELAAAQLGTAQPGVGCPKNRYVSLLGDSSQAVTVSAGQADRDSGPKSLWL
jgi:hypothetical protein